MGTGSEYENIGGGDRQLSLNFTMNEILPGEYCDIVYFINVPANEEEGVYVNNAFATGKDQLGNNIKADNDDFDIVQTTVMDFPSFYITVTPDKFYASKGDTVDFTIYSENIGDISLTIQLEDILPSGFENISSTSYSFLLLPH